MKMTGKVYKGILLSVIVIVFSVSVVYLMTGSEKAGNSEAAVACYDVTTGTETLYTTEELENESGRSKSNSENSVISEPQKAADELAFQKLTEEEQEELENAEAE